MNKKQIEKAITNKTPLYWKETCEDYTLGFRPVCIKSSIIHQVSIIGRENNKWTIQTPYKITSVRSGVLHLQPPQ